MRKIAIAFTLFLLALVGVSANGYAHSISDLYQETYSEPAGGFNYGAGITETWGSGLGTYIGTGEGNLSDPEIISFFQNSGFTDVSVSAVSYTGLGTFAGTWSSNAPVAENLVDFLIVEAETGFSVLEYSAAVSGIWNVGYLPDVGGSQQLPEMFHISAAYTGGTPVPEPATLLLLGSGLVGVWGFRKKLRK